MFKVYNDNGNKTDLLNNKKYYGYQDYNQIYDAYSPQIQPYCSVAK